MTIKAIETRYAGRRFRSRLEARWAVFFTALGIPWEYEPEGFETPSGPYLPDFRIHIRHTSWTNPADNSSVYFEIKPGNAPGSTDPRWHDLAGDHLLFAAYGMEMPEKCCEDGFPRSDRFGFAHIADHSPLYDSRQYFWICPYCSAIGISDYGNYLTREYPLDMEYGTASEWFARRAEIKYKAICCGALWDYPAPMYAGCERDILLAYREALSARFEHNERERI